MRENTPPRGAAGGTPVRRCESLAVVDAEDHVVVLRLDDPRCEPHVLQGTGVALWREIDGIRTVEQIVRVLAERYGANRAMVRRDVLEAVATLQSAGVLQR